ncbi:MAG TPA: VTT domain-containing protein [Bryobacteraceae bacterium]|nr:VTT domain-containing protein [Bryobacteraceae bacterium]
MTPLPGPAAMLLRRGAACLPRPRMEPNRQNGWKGTGLKQFLVALWHKWNVVLLPAILKLGFWGAGAVALLDSSTIPVPMDAILAVWIWKDHGHFWLYAIMAAAGSAVGGLLPYGLGRAGGELFLLKRINRARFEAMRNRFERQEFWAMAIPSMLPPPTPWKACVFAAGVFEMRVVLFMLAVFTGRLIRWLVLSLLVIKLGPGAVQIVQQHALAALGVVGGLAVIGFGLWWRKKRRRGEV